MSLRWQRYKFHRPTQQADKFVTLVVKDEAGRRLTRTMGRNETLRVLMDFYYSTMAPAVKRGSGVFEYRGTQIVFANDQVPADYDMKDGDVIDFLPVVKPENLVTPVLEEHHGQLRSFACTMRRTDPMKSLMDMYREMVPAAAQAATFHFGGRQIGGDETPADLHLEDGSVIVVDRPR